MSETVKYRENTGKVGKGNPPTHTQFQKGHDPRRSPGRPEGAKNRGTVLRQLLDTNLKHTTLDGQEITMTAEQKMLQALVIKAFDGDVQAVREALDSVYGKTDQRHLLGSDPDQPVIFKLDTRFESD